MATSGCLAARIYGMTQYMAASQAHPALKAIFPDVAGFDLYDVMYPGGVFRADMIGHWDRLTRKLDTELHAAKVDTDHSGEMLRQAISDHEDNWEVLKGYTQVPFRDSRDDIPFWDTYNLSPALDRINAAKVPFAYHWNGLLDVFATDAAIWYANYAGPQKLTFGAWPHSVMQDFRFIKERMRLTTIEQHRWFDHWLKGIDNGIMDEKPVHYALLIEPQKWVWMSADQWPPKSSAMCDYYFSQSASGAIDSVNDGSLKLASPGSSSGGDHYVIDLTTTTGSKSRWDNAVGQGGLDYGDLTENDRKCLTYTSQPLAEDLTITGHPIATLLVSSDLIDCNVHVLLEEVDAEGHSHYVSEGVLRASLRKESKAPWNNLGLPYQRCFEQDLQPLSEQAVAQLRMDLHPVAVVINEGNRIRVSIMCADRDNTVSIDVSNDASISVHCNRVHSSKISLPVESHREQQNGRR